MKCLPVSREDAAYKISVLLSKDCVDKRYRIEDVGGRIFIPINGEGCHEDIDAVECMPRLRESFRNPIRDIRNYLIKRGIDADEIPDRWIRYGDSVIIRTSSTHIMELGEAFRTFLRVESVYNNSGRIKGKFRLPTFSLIAGPGGDIIHRENGICYVFNPEKVMFSAGNVNERIRYSRIDLGGKNVIDMFAGIGYFTFPVAKYTGASHVTAVDINPVAISYLRKGIERNGLGKIIETVNADSSFLDYREEFDFVIMGNFDSPLYAAKALDYCKSGGEISMHHLVNSSERSNIDAVLRKIFRDRYDDIAMVETHRVKSYSPKIFHYSTLLRKR